MLVHNEDIAAVFEEMADLLEIEAANPFRVRLLFDEQGIETLEQLAEAAREGRLPRLIEREDLRGDLHCHTRASDGHADIETMTRAARERGVLLSINSDSHSPDGFANPVYGINQARRGWLEKNDVLNTLSSGSLRKRLWATMG